MHNSGFVHGGKKKVRGQSCAIGLEIQQLCLAQLSFYRGIFFSSNYMYLMYLCVLVRRLTPTSSKSLGKTIR